VTTDKLPLFAVTDADLIPSPRMLEGDLHIVIDKLKNLKYKCSAMQLEIEKLRGSVISSCLTTRPTVIFEKNKRSCRRK